MNFRYRQFFTLKIIAYKDCDVWVLKSAGLPELRIKTKSMLLKNAFDFYIELYCIPRDENQKRKFELSHYSDFRKKNDNYQR